MRTLPLVAGLVLAAATLAGCGSSDSDAPSSASTHDAADVTFATDMAQHHQQALQMVALTEGRPLADDFSTLVTTIDSEQSPEIAQMTGWLTSWGEPVPMSTTMGGMGAVDQDTMPGMMSAAEMSTLANASDATFEKQWLTLMIKHHQGALTMAETELADGEYPDALALAQSIDDTQTAEITQMQALLAAG